MRVYHYRPDKAAFAGVFMAALAFGFGKTWWSSGGALLLAFVLLMTLGALKVAYDAINPTPALRFDRTALWVRKTFGGVEEIAWRDVHGIDLYVFTMRYMGVISVGKTEFIDIACEGGMFGARRFRVATGSMDLPSGGAAEVILTLKAAHIAAVGVAGAAMAGAGVRGWGVESDEPSAPQTQFDPDVAIERYLASKPVRDDEEIVEASAAPLQAMPSSHRAQTPQRPVFGRKTA